MKVELVKPSDVYQTNVAGRKTLYLDHNLWIDLADRRTGLAREVRDLLQLAVNAGLLLCPASYPAITELLKQGKNPSSVRQAHVMDALANGVSIRAERHVLDLEVRAAYAYMCGEPAPISREDVYTTIVCFLGDAEIEFQEVWSPDQAADMMEIFRRNTPGVTWLLEHLPVTDFQQRHQAGDDRYVKQLLSLNSDLADFRDGSGKLNAERLRFEEHTYVLKNFILGRLPRVVGPVGMVVGVAKLKQQQMKPGRRTLARIVNAMPSTALSCELHVQRRLAGRAPRGQDRFDQEHAALGVAYCDVFATSDGELFDLLRKAQAARMYETRLLRGLPAVRDFVGALLDSVTVRA